MPDNTIDWDATFFWEENQRLIYEALELDDSVKDSGIVQAMKMMDLGQQFEDKGTDAIIRQYVTKQLKLHGIK